MKVWVMIVISLLISGCQLVSSPSVFSSSVTSTPQPLSSSKQIKLNTLSLVERWRWSGEVDSLSITLPTIATTKDRIVVIGREDARQRIIVFDSRTGQSLWKSEYIASGVRSVAADDKRVYIGTITYVQAFDLETGQELWRGAEQSGMKKGGFVVTLKEGQVEVRDIFEPVVYILDATTGHIVDQIPKDIFFRWNEVDYDIVQGNYLLEARDIASNTRLWTHAFPGHIYSWPVFAGDIMLLNARGQIFGLEARTGEIVWQTTTQTPYTHIEYITGVVLQGDLAYVLRYDAAIVGFDPETGEQVGIMKMMPGRTLEDDGTEVKHYGIAASERYVAVYYGNSQELIVFESVENLNED